MQMYPNVDIHKVYVHKGRYTQMYMYRNVYVQKCRYTQMQIYTNIDKPKW